MQHPEQHHEQREPPFTRVFLDAGEELGSQERGDGLAATGHHARPAPIRGQLEPRDALREDAAPIILVGSEVDLVESLENLGDHGTVRPSQGRQGTSVQQDVEVVDKDAHRRPICDDVVDVDSQAGDPVVEAETADPDQGALIQTERTHECGHGLARTRLVGLARAERPQVVMLRSHRHLGMHHLHQTSVSFVEGRPERVMAIH